MFSAAAERRSSPRVSLSRPCKVYEPRSRRYLPATTCNVSRGGALVRAHRSADLSPGDRVSLGLPHRHPQPVIDSATLVDARIVRVLESTGGEMLLAIEFLESSDELHLPLPAGRAA